MGPQWKLPEANAANVWGRVGAGLGFFMLLAAPVGCSTGKRPQHQPAPVERAAPAAPRRQAPSQQAPTQSESARAAVRAEALRWIGTPHSLGGADSTGMDCSGLVWLVFQKAAGVKLPRVSHEQARFGSPASLAELRPGDLVFFQTPGSRQINHVGIWLGDGRFIHASTQKGVVVSRLAEPYYTQAYRGARVALRD
jgi:cell wall-associated NlpC family hydrolase